MTPSRLVQASALAREARFEEAVAVLRAPLDRLGATECDLLARLLLQCSDPSGALAAANAAVAREPGSAAYHYTRGLAHKALGGLTAAIDSYRAALALDPSLANAHVSLGVALRASGRVEEALDCYRRAVDLEPDNRAAQWNLAAAQASAAGSSPDGAAASGLAAARGLLAEAASDVAAGRPAVALERLTRAVAHGADLVPVWLQIGQLYAGLGQLEASLQAYERAATLQPDHHEALVQAARRAADLGLVERARRLFERADRLQPSAALRAMQALLVPAINDSVAGIEAFRSRYAQNLERLIIRPPSIDQPHRSVWARTFYLAYHGVGNRELQSRLAEFYLRACPSLAFTAPHCAAPPVSRSRLKIGFASQFFGEHSIGRTSTGLIEQLPRGAFEVYVIALPGSPDDARTARIRRAADVYVPLEESLARAREQIAALELDVLFYQDIGMTPFAYFLAYARLAPVQCVSYGHPDTTGIPNLDYFVSNDLYEVEGAQADYSERLFLLEGLPTLAYYERPPAPPRLRSRSSFGIDEASHVYLCPQTLFKLHPSFDELVAGILRRDPRGSVVLIDTYCRDWTVALRARFAATIGDVAERILILPRMDAEAYLDLVAQADVVLDTPHFNGMNSSLEAFSVGTPIVTLPTRLQRGRHTQAMYQVMGLTDWIAADGADYVELAVRLACDPVEAARARRLIGERAALLFEDPRVVTEFARFFTNAVEADRLARTTPPVRPGQFTAPTEPGP